MYGIGIGDDGQAFELGANGKKKIQSTAEIAAKKAVDDKKKADDNKKKQEIAKKNALTAAKNKKAQALKNKANLEADKKAYKAKVVEKVAIAQASKKAAAANQARQAANASRVAMAKEAANKKRKKAVGDRQEAVYLEAQNEFTLSSQMRNLSSMGDGLAGFGAGGEFVNASGTDFGGLWDDLTSKVSSVTSSAGKLTGDTLESWVKKVIERRALIESGDKAFLARMKSVPASATKTKEINDYMAKVKARDSSATHKLYTTFANIVVTATESVSKDRARTLQQLFDNPWMVIQSKGSIDKALSGYDDEGMGIAPLLIGLGVSGAAGTTAAGYVAGSGSDAKIAQAELDKNRKLLTDPNIPANVKAEIAKTIASGTEKLSSAALESAKQGGIIGNIGGAVSKVTTLAVVLGLLFVAVKVGIPMLQARKSA
jgi:hypothetical protein